MQVPVPLKALLQMLLVSSQGLEQVRHFSVSLTISQPLKRHYSYLTFPESRSAYLNISYSISV